MTGSTENAVCLFDRGTAGQTTKPRDIVIERLRVTLFSEAIGETNSIHLRRDAARAAGYPDVVAPPTFGTVIDMAALQDTARDGDPDIHQLIKADFRFLLHGEEKYTYHGPIFAGDTVTHQSTVLGFSQATGGRIEIAHLQTSIAHPERGLLVDSRRALIHNLKGLASR
ncbi:MaoC family dehydratase N-terminal domain-containing protein [Lutimaribacter marinistellae]|uniref:MaoC family dehydratase N-terminal domain-containing protein n=1 Tax=Lutimaribacter marinistellae TaxID=1820329 RepID=A0ABV7TCP2_9RHOB